MTTEKALYKGKIIDLGSTLALVATVLLFGLALFLKGFTHDLLLEAGVFLVSLKLMLATHKLSLQNEAIAAKLDRLLRQDGGDGF